MKSESTGQFTSNVTQNENAGSSDDDTTYTDNFSVNGNYQFPVKKYGLNEKVAAFCSSWKFIALMSAILVIWILFSLVWWYRQ